MKHLFLGIAAVVAAVLLAACQGGGRGSSAATAASAAAQASPTASSGLHCPTLAEAVGATGFTDMTRSGTQVSQDGSAVVCTYAPPATHGTDSRQLEIDVLYTSASLSQAEQADIKAGLTVASEPQYGTGGYMAAGNLPGYGLMCRVAAKASNGAIVAITVTAPDDTAFTPDAACAAVEQAAAVFLP